MTNATISPGAIELKHNRCFFSELLKARRENPATTCMVAFGHYDRHAKTFALVGVIEANKRA